MFSAKIKDGYLKLHTENLQPKLFNAADISSQEAAVSQRLSALLLLHFTKSVSLKERKKVTTLLTE